MAEAKAKLRGTELKLVETESLSLAQADEIANLKLDFNASKQKGYNLGFANVENYMEPVVHQAWNHGFSEGWLAAL